MMRPSVPALAQAGWLCRLDAPVQWRCIDLLSDLHLGPDTPRTTQALLAHLQHTTADAVVLLGDVFEAWVGDDLPTAEPDGFEARVLDALGLAARSRWLGFMPGNRDFLIGADTLQRAGLHGLNDPCVVHAWGESVLLSHGDAWCTDDIEYQRFRDQVRTEAWQSQLLARPLSERQALARQIREASEQRKTTHGPEGYGDLHPEAVRQALLTHGCHVLVHGHTHRPADHDLGGGLQRRVLSDWDLDAGQRAQILRWTPGGLIRLNLPAN